MRLIQLADVGEGAFIDKSARFLTAAKAKELKCTDLKAGDILIARMPDPLGRACVFPGLDQRCVTVVDVCIVRPAPRLVNPSFLCRAINSSTFRQGINKFITGTTRQRISRGNLSKVALALPPLAEQKRIAAVLDKADDLRASRRHALATLDTLLQSVFLDMFGDPSSKKSRHPIAAFRPYMSAQSGKSSDEVRTDTQKAIPIYGGNGVNGWATKALFDEPVIVVGRVGQQCGVTRLTTGPSWVTDNAIAVRIVDHSKVHPVYLAAALQRSPLRATVQHLDLPFVNQSIILDQPLPLPPLALQKRFAEVSAVIGRRREESERGAAHLDALFASLQSAAFAGTLFADAGTSSVVVAKHAPRAGTA